jgi:hypothetical protein
VGAQVGTAEGDKVGKAVGAVGKAVGVKVRTADGAKEQTGTKLDYVGTSVEATSA